MEPNQAQKEAIAHGAGSMLVLAGPGSGKTFVIAARTKRLIQSCGVPPDQILVLTFTRAAAREMKARFFRLCGDTQTGGAHTGVTFGTFHSVFYQILKSAYGLRTQSILREEDKLKLLRGLIEKQLPELREEAELLVGLLSEIAAVKNERLSLDCYYSPSCPAEQFRQLYRAYDSMLRERGLLDFDDMLVFTYELFTARPDILRAWQRRYRYLLIDEFQDINRLQYDCIRLLAGSDANLFAVGDDDQSIYGFRGAKPELMRRFTTDYPNGKTLLLNVNYRSTSQITEAAGRLISKNEQRFPKQVSAAGGSDGTVLTRVFSDTRAQNKTVVEELLRLKQAGASLAEAAVLYRTNTQPRLLAQCLAEHEIPFLLRDRLPCLYDHRVAQCVIAYLRLAMGETDRALFLRVANQPVRYLAREAFSQTQVTQEALLHFYSDKPYVQTRIVRLFADLAMLRELRPFAAVHYIRKAIGLEAQLREEAEQRGLQADELFEVLDELAEDARPYRTHAEWLARIEAFRAELEEKRKQAEQCCEAAVTLTTYHGAKGLEFDTVLLIDVNEGLTPYKRALLKEELEEERRMFYVAVTRARKQLYLFSTQERYGKQVEPSRFLGELLPPVAEGKQ